MRVCVGCRVPAVQLVPVVGGGPATVRSAQSVPLLLGPAGAVTWDGEPCPVHHHGAPAPPLPLPVGPVSLPPRAASVYELRAGTPHSAFAAVAERPLSTRTLGRPPLSPGLLPPMARPRPIVRAENGAAGQLPVREPRKGSLAPPAERPQQKQTAQCGGLKKVMLISLSVIVLGVILAVALIFITK